MLSSRLSFHLVMLLAVFAASSSAGLVPSPEPEPSKAELEGCFKHNNDVHKCIANPSCVWCLAYKTGHQCAHTKDPIFKQNYAPKLKSHIDEMCANPATLNDVFKKAKTAFAHSFQHTAGLDLQAVPTTRRFFAARLIVAVSTDKFTYLYELSSGSSNANKLAIDGVKGSDIAISTAGFWLPVGGFTKPYDEKCEITSTVCGAAFLTTAQLYKPSEQDGGADPTAMAALRAGGSPKDPKIKKEKKDKNAKPFSNHLLVPILERFTSIEQLQISIILSSYCETIFNGVTGLSKPCYDEWRAKCIAASNAWAVFRQNKRLASLPPTPKPLVAAVEAAVKTQYHMAYSDVEAMKIMTNLHHEKPIFAFTGSRFGDLAATLMGYKSCKVPDYIEGTLSEHTAPQK